MCNCVQVSSTGTIANPETFPTGSLKAGIISLTLRSQRVDPLEIQAITVDGKAVIVRNGKVLCTTTVFLTIIPVLVIARTFAGFRLTKRTEKLLTCSPVVFCFPIFAHG